HPVKLLVNVCQRGRRCQQSSRLDVSQVIVLQRKQDVLPDGVLISMVQNLCRGLAFQPVAEFVLLRKHFLIKCCVQFFMCHRSCASFLCALGCVGDRSDTAAFSSASTEGFCFRFTSGSVISSSGSGWASMLSRESSSARRADLTASSSSCGKGFSNSAWAASRCW